MRARGAIVSRQATRIATAGAIPVIGYATCGCDRRHRGRAAGAGRRQAGSMDLADVTRHDSMETID